MAAEQIAGFETSVYNSTTSEIYQNRKRVNNSIPSSAFKLVKSRKIQPDSNIKNKNIPKDVISKQFITLSNRFDYLSSSDEETMEDNVTDNNINSNALENSLEKPKPLFIHFDNLSELLRTIDSVAKNQYTYKIENKNQIKLMPKLTKTYSVLAKFLETRNVSFHTYQLSKDKCFRVVLRGMHYTAPLDDIKDELKEMGHVVLRIHNISNRVTKEPYNLFFLDLQRSINNKDILTLQYLLNAKISFEMPYVKKEIIQCKRCQRFGHSKAYCRHPFRCVKCTGDHSTPDCPKKDGNLTPAKCVHCQEAHPANYKGCHVYREIQNRKFSHNNHVSYNEPQLGHNLPIQTPKVSPRDPRQFNRPSPPAWNPTPETTYRNDIPSQSQDRYFESFPPLPTPRQPLNPPVESNTQSMPNNIEKLLLKQIQNQEKLFEDIQAILRLMTTLLSKLN